MFFVVSLIDISCNLDKNCIIITNYFIVITRTSLRGTSVFSFIATLVLPIVMCSSCFNLRVMIVPPLSNLLDG